MKHLWRAAMFLVAALVLTVSPQAVGQSGVTIEIGSGAPDTTFGVGTFYRPGDITAIRLKLTSHLDKPTPVWVQWGVPNTDGDIQELGRSLTLTPNQPAFTWLYALLPPTTESTTVFTVRVFEEVDGVRGSELGGTRISPSSAGGQWCDIGSGMIAVVGDKKLGLDGYENPRTTRVMRPVGGNEDTRIAFGIRPKMLPDRWEGLLQFEAVAWGGVEAKPQDLGVDQANALREYVRRGGHLIISLPDTGNDWGLGEVGNTQIEDMLPCRELGVSPRRQEKVPVSELLSQLSKFNSVRTAFGNRDPDVNIQYFQDLKSDFNVIDNYFEPLIALDDGRVIVVQRTFGHGRVTVIGVDLTDMRLGVLPQADAFWNRILGRRMETPTAQELIAINNAERYSRRSEHAHENSLHAGGLVTSGNSGINLTSRAHSGLLLAFVLFVAYWLIAGPAGFAVLKHYGRVQHAWVAFAACAAIFTAIAWGSVGMIPKPVELKHITVLDHIATPAHEKITRPADQFYQRATSFFSVYMPDYGDTQIAIASDEGQRDLLNSWSPPGAPTQYFPNADRYRIDVARSPNQFAMPSRSTSTMLSAHWLGGLSAEWGGMLRVTQPITVDAAETTLTGAIANELPGTLRNVTVIWVKNRRSVPSKYWIDSNNGAEQPWVRRSTLPPPPNVAEAWKLSGSFAFDSGTSLDLGTSLKKLSTGETKSFMSAITLRYVENYRKRDMTGLSVTATLDEANRRNYIEMLSMFHLLDPPEYLKLTGGDETEEAVVFQRQMGRELDLSPWFNRPCLIIIGYLEDSECPVPIRLDGDDKPPPSSGLTVVRWIYPLPLMPEEAFDNVFRSPDDLPAETLDGASQ